MENNRGSKAKNFLQKMYHFRVKVNKQDKAIANVSSIFALACLIFAPHMTVVGVVASLLLGYQIRFESAVIVDQRMEEYMRNGIDVHRDALRFCFRPGRDLLLNVFFPVVAG